MSGKNRRGSCSRRAPPAPHLGIGGGVSGVAVICAIGGDRHSAPRSCAREERWAAGLPRRLPPTALTAAADGADCSGRGREQTQNVACCMVRESWGHIICSMAAVASNLPVMISAPAPAQRRFCASSGSIGVPAEGATVWLNTLRLSDRMGRHGRRQWSGARAR